MKRTTLAALVAGGLSIGGLAAYVDDNMAHDGAVRDLIETCVDYGMTWEDTVEDCLARIEERNPALAADFRDDLNTVEVDLDWTDMPELKE